MNVLKLQVVEAYEESRRMNLDAEWQINPELLTHAFKILDFEPDTGLFTGRINCQCSRYAAYRPDPEAVAVNAVSHSWAGMTLYASSTVLCVTQIAAENREGWGTRGGCGPVLTKPDWVSPAGEFIDREASASVTKMESPSNACRSKYRASAEKYHNYLFAKCQV